MLINRLWQNLTKIKESENYKEFQNQIIRWTLTLSFLLAIFLLIFRLNFVALGVLFGCGVSLLNFSLMALDVDKILKLDSKRAFRAARNRSLLRYAILVLVLSLTFWMGGISCFIGAAIGIFLLKISLFVVVLLCKSDVREFRKSI